MVQTYQPSGPQYYPTLEDEEIPVEETDAPAPESSVAAQDAQDAAGRERIMAIGSEPDPAPQEIPVEEEAPAPAAQPAPAPADQSTIDYQNEVDAAARQRMLAYDPAQPEQAQTVSGREQLQQEGAAIQAEQAAAAPEPAPSGYGTDEQGNALPPAREGNVVQRAADQLTGNDGFQPGDLNPLNLGRNALVGLGMIADEPRLQNVGMQGQQALDDLRGGYTQEAANKLEQAVLRRRMSTPGGNPLGGLVAAAPVALEALRDGENPLRAGAEVLSATYRGAVGDQISGTVGPTFDEWAYDPSNTERILDAGNNGYKGLSGGDAVYQLYQDETSGDGIGGMLTRGVRDLASDPTIPVSGVLGAVGQGMGRAAGLARAANIALDPIGEAILPAAGRAVRASGIGGKVANTPVGRLLQPSQTTQAEEELTSTAETLAGALDDADANEAANLFAPGAAQAAPSPGPTASPAAPPTATVTRAAPPAAPARQAAPASTTAAPSGPPVREADLVAAAPRPIIPVRRGGEIVGLRDLETGVERALSANPAEDAALLIERLKLLPLGEYRDMREAWFPGGLFRNGLGQSQFLDAYYPNSGPAYDNYIDLMASRIRLWGADGYEDMWNMWVRDNVAARKWREALHGIQTWENVQLHSGIVDPDRAARFTSEDLQRAIDVADERGLRQPDLWDPARLAGRPLPPARNVISARRRTVNIRQSANANVPLPPELLPEAATPVRQAMPGGGGAPPPPNLPGGVPAGSAAAPTPPPSGPTPTAPRTPAMQRFVNRLTGNAAPNWRDRLTGAINNAVDPEVTATLDRMASGRTLGDRVWEMREDLLDAQQRILAGATIDTDPVLAQTMERLDGLVTPEQLGRIDRRGVNRVAALRASLDLLGDRQFKAKYPAYFERQARRADDLSLRGAARGLTQELPAAVLYNYARIIPFATQQFLGNATSLGVAGQAGALGKFINFRNNRAIFQRSRQGLGATVETEFDRILRVAGLPVSDTFRMGGPAGEQGATLSRQLRQSSIYQKMGQVIAPQALRDFGGISDLALREAVGMRELVRLAADARQAVRSGAVDRAARFGVRVSQDQVDAAVRAVQDAAVREGGQPIFSAASLREALERSGAVGQDVPKWADRIARDYQAALKQAYGGAKQETERIGFSFRKTNADEALGKVVFFTYWNLRASNLYARSLLKNPPLLAAYGRGMEALTAEAEQEGYPDYLRGWLRYMSDAGVNGYLDPRRSFSTMLTLAEESFKNPDGDLNRMTGLGRAAEALPGMVNPVLGFMLYAIGAMGADATAPDPTGTGAMFRTGYDVANRIKTMMGGENLDPVLRAPVQAFVNTLASGISGVTSEWFPELQQVERKNPSAQWESRVNWLTQQAIREDHPDWSEDQVLALASEVLGDLENEYVQEAIDRAAAMPLSGPGSQVPVVGGVLGALTANALGIQARPSIQDANAAIRSNAREVGRDNLTPSQQEELDRAYLARDIAQAAGPQDLAFERSIDAYKNIGSDEQRQANDLYKQIRYKGVLPGGSVEVAGQRYTQQQIAGWDDERRRNLAEAYMREQGTWRQYQAFKDSQDLFKQRNPELVDYFDFESVAENYVGGPEAWADATRRSNPNYDQYLTSKENLDARYRAGGSQRDDALTGPEAYRAAKGIPNSLYDVPIPPGDSGYFIAGIPTGLTPTQASQLGGGGNGGTGQGAGATYNEEAKAKLEGDLGNYAGMVAIMNEYDAAVGNAPGTTQRTYNIKLITGDKKTKLPSDVYNAIDDAYGYVFPSQGKFKDYLTWATDADANPTGSTAVDDFLDWDRGQYLQRELSQPDPAQGGAIDVTAGLRGTRDASGNLIFGTAPEASPAAGGEVLTLSTASPGLVDPYNQWSALLEVPPLLPLRPVTGPNTKVVGPTADWRLVELPDGSQVWVQAALLRSAA